MKQLTVTPGQRELSGVIATLRRGDETRAEHFYGFGRTAVRRVAEFCDAGGWRVVTLSTPTTVWRDLQGLRRTAPDGSSVGFPEEYMLGIVGRIDLFDSPVERRGKGHG